MCFKFLKKKTNRRTGVFLIKADTNWPDTGIYNLVSIMYIKCWGHVYGLQKMERFETENDLEINVINMYVT